MRELASLPSLLVEPIVRAALVEDLGRAGDITTTAVVPREARKRALRCVLHAISARLDTIVRLGDHWALNVRLRV